ncbi:glycosyltransferase [Desulfovibrio sp. OttesenSCG-928-F20]|nr:glycosyltransferase [Desulfovibrio sp. OttesenSCG-928-F20]
MSGRKRFGWNPFIYEQGNGYWEQPVSEVPEMQDKALTRLLYLVWWGRKDRQADFALKDDAGCEKFARWYLDWGGKSVALPPGSVLLSAYWDALELQEQGAQGPLSRLQRLFHERDATLQERFDLQSPDSRIAYAAWFAKNRGTLLSTVPGTDAQESEPGPPVIKRTGSFKQGGVNIIGFARGELGIGEDVRMAAASLRSAKTPFVVLDAPLDIRSRCGNNALDSDIVAEPVYSANLIYMPCLETLRLFLSKGGCCFPGRYNIATWQWELARRPPEWTPVFGLVREVWAPTRFIAGAMEENAPVPVRLMPLAVSLPLVENCSRSDFGLPKDAFLFIFMFDANSRFGRKNPLAVVEAFKRAFPGRDDNVGLVIKAMYCNDNAPGWQDLLTAIQGDKRVHIINETLAPALVMGLLQQCDALVSLHRSEGFGRTMAEALLLEKGVIASAYSGNLDFTTPDTAYLVEGRIIPVPDDAYPFSRGQVWFDPDLDHAAHMMRICAQDSAQMRMKNRAGKRLIEERFSPAAVGKLQTARLRELGIV